MLSPFESGSAPPAARSLAVSWSSHRLSLGAVGLVQVDTLAILDQLVQAAGSGSGWGRERCWCLEHGMERAECEGGGAAAAPRRLNDSSIVWGGCSEAKALLGKASAGDVEGINHSHA